MKLTTLAVFGVGYVLGSKAGRERYDQLAAAVGRMIDGLEGSRAQERLDGYASRLETYASRNGRTEFSGEGARRSGAGF